MIGAGIGSLSGGMAGAAGGTALSATLSAMGLGGIVGLLRSDPEVQTHFFLEINGLAVARFKEASGLKMTTKTTPYREGGNNMYDYHFIEGMSWEPLVLKRGYYAAESDFYAWMRQVHDASIEGGTVANNPPDKPEWKRDIELVILTQDWVEMVRFSFKNAFIFEYEGPKFDAQAKDIAFETIKIRYDYFDVTPASFTDKLLDAGLSMGISAAGSI